MPQPQLAPPDDAFDHARFYGFHNAPRPHPLARVEIGGEPATAQLDCTVQRMRARDDQPILDLADQDDGSGFYRALSVGVAASLMIWVAIGVLFAWLAGRL